MTEPVDGDRRLDRAVVGLTAALTLVDLAWLAPMNGPARRLDEAGYRAVHRAAVRVGGTAAPILAVPTLIASVVISVRRRRAGRPVAANLVGVACLLANAGVTFAVNVPVNGVFTAEAALPADWPRLRRRWRRAHNVRTAVQLAGLVATTVAGRGRGGVGGGV